MRVRRSCATAAGISPRWTASCRADSVWERSSVGARSSCAPGTSTPALARWRTALASTTNLVIGYLRLGVGASHTTVRGRRVGRVLAHRLRARCAAPDAHHPPGRTACWSSGAPTEPDAIPHLVNGATAAVLGQLSLEVRPTAYCAEKRLVGRTSSR